MGILFDAPLEPPLEIRRIRIEREKTLNDGQSKYAADDPMLVRVIPAFDTNLEFEEFIKYFLIIRANHDFPLC